jgi:hypothetical protein
MRNEEAVVSWTHLLLLASTSPSLQNNMQTCTHTIPPPPTTTHTTSQPLNKPHPNTHHQSTHQSIHPSPHSPLQLLVLLRQQPFHRVQVGFKAPAVPIRHVQQVDLLLLCCVVWWVGGGGGRGMLMFFLVFLCVFACEARII